MRRLDVCIGFACNNNCIFCLGGGPRPFSYDTNGILRRIESIENPQEVELNILGGEPTVYPHLETILLAAKRKGIKDVTIVTNGKRLSDLSYLKKLLLCGLSRITISFHGPTREIQEEITQVPGSYEQTTTAIRNCALMRRSGLLKHKLSTHTVICKQNVDHLVEMADLLNSLGVEEQTYSFITPRARADENFDLVVPRLSHAASRVKQLLDERPDYPIKVNDFPNCLLKGYEEHISTCLNVDAEVWQLRGTGKGKRELEFHKFYYDRVRATEYKTKTRKCEQCRASLCCEGVFKRYLEEYGDGELEPY